MTMHDQEAMIFKFQSISKSHKITIDLNTAPTSSKSGIEKLSLIQTFQPIQQGLNPFWITTFELKP